jgi:EmrB/QacA subfamily drug resistance transporter
MTQRTVAAAGAAPALAKRQIHTVLGGLMTATLLGALDQTVMSTALPTIVGKFGGLDHYAWVVTAYLLTSTASMPLYGSMSDMYGRRSALNFAVATFLIGSVLCGAAQGMLQLILFRAVQGLGAGGLMTLSFTVVGDLVPPRERARYQGMFGAVFGLASVAGPLVGGYLTEYNWRWIFFLNLPLGAVAMVVTDRVLRHVPHHRRAHTVDYLGAAVLVGAVSCVLTMTSLGGRQYAWTAPPLIAVGALGLLLAVVFAIVERRAAEPILPIDLFRRRNFALANATAFVFGMLMFGAVVYTPLYLQVVKGYSPTASGLLMLPMMAGVVIASILGGRMISRIGRYKWFTVAGAATTSAGVLAGVTLTVASPLPYTFAVMAVIGVGMGLLMQPLIVAVQHGLARSELGAGTASGAFLRQLGGSLGVAILGAVLSNRLAGTIAPGLAPLLKEPARILALPEPLRTTIRAAFVDSLHAVFVVAAVMGVVSIVLTSLLADNAIDAGHTGPTRDDHG